MGGCDVFFTTFNQGNFVLINRAGTFDYAARKAIPNNHAVLTVSPAFADMDNNGLLDVVNGNMALGVVTGSYSMTARRANSIVFNGGTELRDVALETDSGETMSTLVSDFNNDGLLDINFSNDFIVADKILLGTQNGFKEADANSGFIGATPFFSMSADTGDFDNDLQLDFLTMGTTAMGHDIGKLAIDGVEPAVYTKPKWNSATCDGIQDATRRERCARIRDSDFLSETRAVKSVDIAQCQALGDAHEIQGCLLVAMWHLITNNAPADNCVQRYGTDPLIVQVCDVLAARTRLIHHQEQPHAIAQSDHNFVYRYDGTKLADINTTTPGAFAHPGGWTWNGKFVDLDNDGWQDVFNADGAIRKGGYGWNVFMKNIKGLRFEQQQFSYNLADDFGLYSFVTIDMDHDGDLDIIGNAAFGPARIFENRATQSNRSLAVSLHDKRGNRYGIGAKIYLSYANGTQHQMREIKASGGYQSFDAPIAYFGLGDTRSIDGIRVRWRDGTDSVLNGPFDAGFVYRVERE